MVVKHTTPEAIIGPSRHLHRDVGYFWCPYCDTAWARGGGKEGFVKSAASNHVAACEEVLLFQAGYIYWSIKRGEGWQSIALPIAGIVRGSQQAERLRRVRALVRSRARAGLVVRRPL